MRRLRYFSSGTLWTLALGVPATLLALGLVAFLDQHLYSIAAGLTAALRANWEALSLEASARWPEVAGMLIGQLLLMTILVVGGAKVLGRNAEAG